MRRAKIVSVLVVWMALIGVAHAATVKVATYNIWFLKENISNVRADRIRGVIEELDADVIGLQEIRDRDALERVFDPDEWHLIIDDESGDDQDVALAVRKPLEVVGLNSSPTDLDADDDDFLYPSNQDNFFFPNRRDVLIVQIEEPGSGARFFVMAHHAKARSGGRGATDNRREGDVLAFGVLVAVDDLLFRDFAVDRAALLVANPAVADAVELVQRNGRAGTRGRIGFERNRDEADTEMTRPGGRIASLPQGKTSGSDLPCERCRQSIADLIPTAPGDRVQWGHLRTGPAGKLRLHRC